MRRQQRPACLCTAAAHRRRRAGFTEQQQRLVARIFRTALSIQYMNRFALAPVAPADNADLDAFFLQTRHQRGDNRRFSRPARVDIADHDHRHGQLFAFQTTRNEIIAPFRRNFGKQLG